MKTLLGKVYLLSLCILILSSSIDSTVFVEKRDQNELAFKQYTDSIAQTLHYEHGLISIANGISNIKIPNGFKYLGPSDSEKILTTFWGNPPSGEGNKSLGMLIPEHHNPAKDSTFAINITYSEAGYVDDKGAHSIDYDQVLYNIQQNELEGNRRRQAMGYPTVKILNWVSPPFYDNLNNKIHWAQELEFGDMEETILNYNIRILGRNGYLELIIIGEMYMLDEIKASIDEILQSIEFNDGFKYSDFNPQKDKVAEYGIKGLVSGSTADNNSQQSNEITHFSNMKIVGISAIILILFGLYFFSKNEMQE